MQTVKTLAVCDWLIQYSRAPLSLSSFLAHDALPLIKLTQSVYKSVNRLVNYVVYNV